MLEIDRERYEVTVKGQQINLPPKEYAVLCALKEADGRVLTRRKILEVCWGKKFTAWDKRIVDQHVARLRKNLKKFKAHGLIVTVPSAGYKFKQA